MSPVSLLKEAGLLCYPDSVDVDHLRYDRQTRRRANRFAAFQIQVLAAGCEPGTYAGRLVGLDLVRPSELPAVLGAAPYRLRGRACVEWPAVDGLRIDRRALCSFTTIAVKGRAASADSELTALNSLLASVSEYQTVAEKNRLVELERDMVCWAAQRLPRPLWAHVSWLRPMSALPRHQVALQDVDGVPLLELDEVAASRRAEAADMLDAAVAAGRAATAPLLVELSTAVFKIKQGEARADTLDRWTRELLALRARVEAGDVASAVIVAWNLDLVQSGTLTEVDAALETRARYARRQIHVPSSRLRGTGMRSHRGRTMPACPADTWVQLRDKAKPVLERSGAAGPIQLCLPLPRGQRHRRPFGAIAPCDSIAAVAAGRPEQLIGGLLPIT